jgi:hypothetical protein
MHTGLGGGGSPEAGSYAMQLVPTVVAKVVSDGGSSVVTTGATVTTPPRDGAVMK